MHIECFKNSGKPYLRIVEGIYTNNNGKVKIKKNVLKNIGPLSKYDDGQPDFLKRFREGFKNGTIVIDTINNKRELIDNQIINIPFSKSDFNLNLKNLGYLFIENYYNQLGIYDLLREVKSDSKIQYDLNGLTKLLVFGRILDPKSKKATFENKDKYLFGVTSSDELNDIYKALDVLDKKSNAIQKRMNTKIKQSSIGRKADLTYYDVTNYYFETMYGDEDVFELDEDGNKVLDEKGKPIILEKGLRKKGVGKDGKPNPLVAMGLFIDNNGIPVSFNTFPGNTQDKTTFTTMIKSTLNKEEFGKVVAVADNGMNAQENMYLLVTNGNGYIISKSIKKSWNTKPLHVGIKTVKDFALDDDRYEYKKKDGIITFKSKSRIYERTLKDKDGNSITIKEKEVIFWSKAHYDRELHQNEKFIEYLESCKEHPDKLKDKQRKSQEFIKVVQTDKKTGEILKTKAVVVLLDEKIEKYKETLGYYSIVTSEIDLSDSEIISRYHGLSRIEDSFRIIKSDLEGRPIFVWTKEHINAHFLICFIALTIIRLIQYKVLKYQGKNTLNIDGWEQGITAEKIKEALNGFQVDKLPNYYYKVNNINDDIKTILNSLEIDYELTIPTLSKLNKLKSQIKSKTI